MAKKHLKTTIEIYVYAYGENRENKENAFISDKIRQMWDCGDAVFTLKAFIFVSVIFLLGDAWKKTFFFRYWYFLYIVSVETAVFKKIDRKNYDV